MLLVRGALAIRARLTNAVAGLYVDVYTWGLKAVFYVGHKKNNNNNKSRSKFAWLTKLPGKVFEVCGTIQ